MMKMKKTDLARESAGKHESAVSELFAATNEAGGLRKTINLFSHSYRPHRSDLFIDWAKPKRKDGKTKGIGIISHDMSKSKKVELEEIYEQFPPPRRLFIEGIPTKWRDTLIDAGYEVYTCHSQSLVKIRREKITSSEDESEFLHKTVTREFNFDGSSSKSDKNDPKMLRDNTTLIKWHKQTRTDSFTVQGIKLIKNRNTLVALSKLAAQHASSESYGDVRFFDSIQNDIELKLKEATKEIEKFCKEIGLHKYHNDKSAASATSHKTEQRERGGLTFLYGVGCVTIVTAMTRRPWLYTKSGWRTINGINDRAYYAERATKRSLCDANLKSLLHGSIMILINKKSPYRELYEKEKKRLQDYRKPGKSGKGTLKVTSHNRAVNRVKTKVILDLYTKINEWFYNEKLGKSEELQNSGFYELPKSSPSLRGV